MFCEVFGGCIICKILFWGCAASWLLVKVFGCPWGLCYATFIFFLLGLYGMQLFLFFVFVFSEVLGGYMICNHFWRSLEYVICNSSVGDFLRGIWHATCFVCGGPWGLCDMQLSFRGPLGFRVCNLFFEGPYSLHEDPMIYEMFWLDSMLCKSPVLSQIPAKCTPLNSIL